MTRPKSYQPPTAEQLSAIASAAGKKARAASPWGKHPMCGTKRAAMSRMNYLKRGK